MRSRIQIKIRFLCAGLLTIVMPSLVSSLLTGCATIVDTPQVIRVQSQPPGAEVFYKGKDLGHTPMLVQVEPQHYGQIELKYKDKSEVLRMAGDYRWGKSFAANLIFFSLAPVGWVTDLISGHAWRFRKDYNFSFSPDARASVGVSGTGEMPVVAIAPPLFSHANLSDEIAERLQVKLQKDFGGYRIADYKATFDFFDKFGVDFDSPVDDNIRYNLFLKAEVDKIFFSQIRIDKKTITVEGELADVLHPETTVKKTYTFDREEVQNANWSAWLADPESLFYWLPNTVSLDLGSTATQFKVNGVTTTAKAQAPDGPLGQALTVVSAVSLRRITPPINRDRWAFRFTFVPTASLSYANEQFDTIPALEGQTFHRFHADAGWGPSLNYGSKKWNFYFNFLPILAFDQVSTTARGQTYTDNDTHGTFAVETGVMYFVSQNWLARFYARSAEVPVHVWEQVIGEALQTNADLQTASVQSAGISIGYIIPNEYLRF